MSKDTNSGNGSLAVQVGGAVAQFLNTVYADLAKPSVVAVGRALSTVVETSTALALPLELWTKKRRLILEHNIKRFEEDLARAQQKPATVVPVPPEIGNPILEKLAYTSDESLSALFIRLLRRASIAEESKLAHPRFIDIISNLSPDEARILSATCESNSFRCLSIRWESEVKTNDGRRERHYFFGERFLSGLENNTLILFPENIPKYLTSLQSLGLLEIREDTYLDEASPPLKEYEALLSMYSAIAVNGLLNKDNFKSKVVMGRIDYTEFGQFFLDACVREENQLLEDDQRRKFPSRQTTKKIREALIVQNEKPKEAPKPILQLFNDAHYQLVSKLNTLADQALIPSDKNYIKRAKVLRDMKILSRSDLSVIKDFNTIVMDLAAGFGTDEETMSFSIKEITLLLSRL